VTLPSAKDIEREVGSELPRLLEACVEEGALSMDIARVVASYGSVHGISALEALVQLDVLGAGREGKSSGSGSGRGAYIPALFADGARSKLALEEFVEATENGDTIRTVYRYCRGELPHPPSLIIVSGDAGTGKTHLLSAAAARCPQDETVFAHMTDVAMELETARRKCRRAELRSWFASRFTILLDDLHVVAADTELQRELIGLIDGAATRGARIVATSLRPLVRLSGLDEQLRSRLASGLSLRLVPLTENELASLLEKRVKASAGTFPRDVALHLAGIVQGDVRRALSLADRAIGLAKSAGRALTVEVAQTLIAGEEPSQKKRLSSIPPAAFAPGEHKEMAPPLPPFTDRVSLFRDMLDAAENEEEQRLALQIALSERLRELRESGAGAEAVIQIENALELLREGKIEEAMRCMTGP